MAATATLKSVNANIKLNNGTTTTGLVKTVNVRLGSISPTSWDIVKGYAIADALAPCFDKAVYEVQEVRTSTISNE